MNTDGFPHEAVNAGCPASTKGQSYQNADVTRTSLKAQFEATQAELARLEGQLAAWDIITEVVEDHEVKTHGAD